MAQEAQRIDGKAIAAEVVEIVKRGTADLKASHGVVPGLVTVIVGEDPASEIYVASKGRMAEACGFHSVRHSLSAETSEAELLDLVGSLNADPAIHGILVQLPLPGHIDEKAVIRAIDPDKDVDGFHVENAGRLMTGDLERAFVPCTPAGVMIMLARTIGRDLSGRHAVVVGRSNIVGKPVAALLLAANATVTIAHSRTADLAAICRQGDILVAAVGRKGLIGADHIKPGAVVIDVGTNRIPAPERGEGKTRLVGDVDFEAALPIASAITPVPGGVGPMTIALLMANTLTAACRSVGVEPPSFAAA